MTQHQTSNPMKPVWGLFVILIGVIAVVAISKAFRPNEVIPWRTDFTKASDEARSSGKPVFLYLTASWCGPCQSLKSTTWADADVESALRNFVPLKIDIDEHPDLARRYNPEGVPYFAVLNSSGDPRKTAVGALPPAGFLAWLRGS
jgi:thiol:disulfide interchange protein